MPTTWALLIGVDFYFCAKDGKAAPRNVKFKNLSGCVRDVSRVEKYLTSPAFDKDPAHEVVIKKLTASVRVDKNTDGPQESEETLPTYPNIKREIEGIYDAAHSGDLVYIHYSGHGILRQKIGTSDYQKGDHMSGTALGLTDVMIGGAYLTGHQLGVWARKMIAHKGVRVIVILDSCHSGQAHRAGNDDELFNLRTSDTDTTDTSSTDEDRKAQEDAQKDEIFITNAAAAESRNSTLPTTDWLSSPKGCTILTACQLDEQAGEYRFPGQDGHSGILTHWVLDLVTNSAAPGPYSYEALRRHVVQRTRATGATGKRQNAVLHGEGFIEVMGHRRLRQRSVCLVEVKDREGNARVDKVFQVHVGATQGVAPGASYDIYKVASNFEQMADGAQALRKLDPRRIRVDRVFPLHCEAILVDNDPDNSEAIQHEEIQTGEWFEAVLNSWALPQKSQQFINKLEKEIDKAAAQQPGSSPPSDSPTRRPGPFHVAIDDKGDGTRGFRIKTDNGQPMDRVPFIRIKDISARRKVSYMLRHLARFHALRNHDYGRPNAAADSNFTFKLKGIDKKIDCSDGTYKTNNGQKVTIQFKNKSAGPVHVAIFTFNATWGVQRLWPPVEDAQTTTHVAANGMVSFNVNMKVPPTANETDTSTIYDQVRAYVYVGDHPLSWDEICQPDLPSQGVSVPTRVQMGLPRRSAESQSEVEEGFRNTDVESPVRNLEEGQWAALDFEIQTSPL